MFAFHSHLKRTSTTFPRYLTTVVSSKTDPFPFMVSATLQPSSTTTIPTPSLISFTSPKGKSLFRNAMDQGQAESFFKLMGNFSAQSSPDLAGISSCKSIYKNKISIFYLLKKYVYSLFFTIILNSNDGFECFRN